MIFHKKQEHHIQSIIMSGIVISILLVVFLIVLINRIVLQPQADADFSPFNPAGDNSELSSDAVATLGQNYIKDLASYELSTNNPVILKEVELLEQGVWMAQYEVEQLFNEDKQIYYYVLEIKDGHVIRHNSSVSDFTRTLLVTSPEADQIASSNRMFIKGQLYPPANSEVLADINIEVIDLNNNTILTNNAKIVKNEGNSYLKEIVLPSNVDGELIAKVSYGNFHVMLPFVFANTRK